MESPAEVANHGAGQSAQALRAAIKRLVIVGGSVGAAHAVAEARRLGFGGDITIISAEREPLYDRPPLSKQFLVSDEPVAPTMLVDVDELDVRLMADTTATGIDVRNREVRTERGTVSFDGLIIATGAEPRALDTAPVTAGVHPLRTANDAAQIRDRLKPGTRVVVVGAGFIGGEIASSARARGADVTMVESRHLPLEAAVGSLVAERLALLHQEHGVDLRTRTTVRAVEGPQVVDRIVLSDGSTIEADLVVVGIGVTPATGWLKGSGIAMNDGVSCTPYLESTAPDIYAIGDVARWVNPWNGRSSRLEHWTSTTEQAQVAVANLLSHTRTECSIVPYFWSDWYGHKLQLLGEPADEVELTGEGGATDPFVTHYRYDSHLVGAFALDRTGPLMRLRRHIAARAPWDELLRNTPAPR